MAKVSSAILGDFKNLSVPKEQNYNDFMKSDYLTINSSYSYYDEFYISTGFNFGEMFNNPTIGSVAKIATLKNGNYIGLKVENYNPNTDNRFQYKKDLLSATLNLYSPSGNIIQAISNTFNYSLKFTIKNTAEVIIMPLRISVIFDDDSKEAWIIIAGLGDYDNGTFAYNPNNGHYWHCYNVFNKISPTDLYKIVAENVREYDPDPWSGAGYSGIGGGDGTFDFKSDNIDLPDLPSVDAVSSGFLQLFTGSLSNILDLSRYMWSTNFFDNIVKITSNPIDIIMGLYMYPFTIPATNQKYIRAGNVITNIKMFVPNSQIFEIDCGSVDIPNFYGAYLDYEPFTKCDLFLPYCGTFPLSMDDIAGKTINVKYRIDLLTGVCGAYVIIDGAVRYNFVGTCAINIPISSRSFENVYSSIMGIVGSMHGGSSFGLPSVGSVAGAVTSGKNQIQHGGNCSGNAGYLGVQKPYLIFSIPRVAIPKGLNTYTGYPIFATYKLADLKGYTEIEQIHLENMGQATQEEIDKIISMLEGGVIL